MSQDYDQAAFDDEMSMLENHDEDSAATAAMEETLREIEAESDVEHAELEDIALDAQRAASAEERETTEQMNEAERAARAEEEKKSKKKKRRQNILNMYRTESRADRQKRKRESRNSLGRKSRSRVPSSMKGEENKNERFEDRYSRFNEDRRYTDVGETDEVEEDPSRTMARERLDMRTLKIMERRTRRLLAANERGDSYYKILGVRRSTNGMKEIKQAYRRLALEAHPDKNLAKQAPKAFKVLQDAYETLTSDREKYDRYLQKKERVRRQRLRRRTIETCQDLAEIGHVGWTRMVLGSKQALTSTGSILSWKMLFLSFVIFA